MLCVASVEASVKPHWPRRFPGNLTSANLVAVGTRGPIPNLYVSMSIVDDRPEHSYFNRIQDETMDDSCGRVTYFLLS